MVEAYDPVERLIMAPSLETVLNWA